LFYSDGAVLYYDDEYGQWGYQLYGTNDLVARYASFRDYYNRTMAKPIKWTYTGLAPDRGAI